MGQTSAPRRRRATGFSTLTRWVATLTLVGCGSNYGSPGGGGPPLSYNDGAVFDAGQGGDVAPSDGGASDTGTPGSDTTAPTTDTGGPGADTSADTSAGCVATTCAAKGATCGTLPDGCGGTLSCGSCSGGQTCGAGNVCTNTPCEKKTCAQLGVACGSASDGCGGTQTCPGCGAGKTCQSNQCVCAPKTCAELSATCGQVDNGCGQALDCGVCPTCQVGCPSGYACSQAGVCSGGDPTKLVLNIQTVAVSGVVTLNGAKPQFTQYCTASSSSKYLRVRFVEHTFGYTFDILRSCKSLPHDFSFEAALFPGTYTVYAAGYSSSYSDLPTTQQVIYDKLTLTKPTSGLVLNVTTVPVSGVVTLNGQKPQFTQYCTASSSSKYLRVRFVEQDRGYSFDVLRSCKSLPHDFSFEAVLFPGTYTVYAAGYSSSYSNLPTTQQVIFDKLTVAKATPGLVLNVTTVPISGLVTLNGNKPQFTQYCTASSSSKYLRVRFVEKQRGYTFDVLRSCKSVPHDFSFEAVLFPGTYRVYAAGYSSSYSDLPTTQQVLYSALKVSKPTSGLVLNITTVPVSGVVTLNGNKPQFTQYCTASSSSKYLRVRFVEKDLGYTFDVLRSCKSVPHDFSFETVLFPGTYTVYAAGYSSSYSDLPTTQQVIYDALKVSQATSGLALNITTVPVSGLVTLNGAKPQFTQYCTASSSSKYLRVRFVEKERGYTFDVLRSCKSVPHDFSFEAVLFPGTYTVYAAGYSSSYSDLPTTQQVIYDALKVSKPTPGLVLNITTVAVAGVVTLNGQTPKFTQYCTSSSSSKYLRVRLVEVVRGYTFDILRSCKSTPHDFSFSAVVFPGVYRVYASGYSSSYSDLPTTQQIVVSQLKVP